MFVKKKLKKNAKIKFEIIKINVLLIYFRKNLREKNGSSRISSQKERTSKMLH